MGCSQSQLEADEEGRSAFRPPGSRRIHDLRRRRGRSDRKYADLPASESSEAGDDLPQRRKKKAGLGPALGGEGKGGKGDDGEEELPRSPSFRFYFEGPWEDKDSAKGVDEGKEHGKTDDKKENNKHRRDDNFTSNTSLRSSKGSEGKRTKKDKGRRFKAITKGSSVVYNSLVNRS